MTVNVMSTALRALHEVLVAARNIGVDPARSGAVADIIDAIEAIPLWMADSVRDRTKDIVAVYRALAAEHAECAMAAARAEHLLS